MINQDAYQIGWSAYVAARSRNPKLDKSLLVLKKESVMVPRSKLDAAWLLGWDAAKTCNKHMRDERP